MKKAPLAAAFILAAQPVVAQEVATTTPAQTATPDLSKFISLPEGPNGQWVIHGKNEITIHCMKGEKTADGKPGNPNLAINLGMFTLQGDHLNYGRSIETLNLPKSAGLPSKISYTFNAEDYCNPNGTVIGNGQKLVDNLIRQSAEQLKVPRLKLVELLAKLGYN